MYSYASLFYNNNNNNCNSVWKSSLSLCLSLQTTATKQNEDIF